MNTHPNLKIDRSDWCRDSYRGTADALIEHGVLKPAELIPQNGRMPGKAVFLPSGEPCPPTCRAWREPGYKGVFVCENGEVIVEITVSREEQQTRRAAQRAAEQERREQRLNKALAERGRDLIPSQVRHEFSDWCESWEGTKQQLHGVGIGFGLAFPGEPGAPKTIHCTCPLGFSVEIGAHYDETKAAAGLFRAISRYATPMWDWATETISFAAGVVQEIRPIDRATTRYVGGAQALLLARIVPRADLFPGQPGRNKQQCSYRTDFSAASTANGQSWALTIRRRGKNRFEVEVPLSKDEAARREAKYKRLSEEHEAATRLARQEREQLRQASRQEDADNGVEAFRAEAERYVEVGLRIVEMVFNDDKTLYTFDKEVLEDLSGAFAAIRGAVHTASVVKNRAIAQRLDQQKQVIAAKADAVLQSFLQQVRTRPVDG